MVGEQTDMRGLYGLELGGLVEREVEGAVDFIQVAG